MRCEYRGHSHHIGRRHCHRFDPRWPGPRRRAYRVDFPIDRVHHRHGGDDRSLLRSKPAFRRSEIHQLVSLALTNLPHDVKGTITQILDLANVSRKQGLLALEGKLKDLHDPFFKKGIQLIVDGTDPKLLQEILEIEVEHHEEEGVHAAKVWEAAGGYAPTVGILGAVLGLIHVMENLADPSKLGGGIAVAFVATVYGVGAANLFFLPIANKIKFKLKEEAGLRTMVIMGLVGLAQGENPRLLQEKLESYLPPHERTKEDKK
jgi:chemotaxis protein MotA